MARATPPRDRFDELPAADGRVGAHRAENPRMRPGIVLLWAAAATVALVALGIFGTLVATGRISLTTAPTPTPTPTATITPVIDTTYQVLVLNATDQAGLASSVRDAVVGAGWASDAVTPGDAGSTGFDTTTVYYADPADEAAALGLAQAIGGAAVVQSDVYSKINPGVKQLAIVIGLDRVPGAATPTG